MKKAVIDLGTNTFHLLIAEKNEDTFRKLFETSLAVKIGLGGINQGIITNEATERALFGLQKFQRELYSWGIMPSEVLAVGTSAIRNASNKAEFIEKIFNQTGIRVQEISGDKEAELIYLGVKQAIKLSTDTSLMMDIGGGSVEFIIGNATKIFWKQSFEIGGQRLLDKFIKTDPMSMYALQQMNDYFQEQLMALSNAVHQYQPVVLAGSSGTFDTLADMYYYKQNMVFTDNKPIEMELPLMDFYQSYESIITKNRTERMALGGMIELRVDLIVVAVSLIAYIIKTYKLSRIRVTTYALKEGLMAAFLEDSFNL